MIFISRPISGRRSVLPMCDLYRASSGFTATAVSPSIVSGRVVAIVMFAAAVRERVANVPEVSRYIFVIDFEI